MGTTRDIAEFACKTVFDDFDPALVKKAKDVLLSGVGMTMAGMGTDAARAVLGYINEFSASQDASVFGAGVRTSAELAALANGTASHSTELEDDSAPDLIYSVGIFPGVFAIGEKQHASGKEIIEAFAISWDIAGKLSMPAVERGALSRFMLPSFCTIGIAAGAAKLMKLGMEKTTTAISVATSHANWCVLSQAGTGSHLFEAGLAGKNGIASASLAKHGLTGHPDIMEMPRGYFEGVAGEAYAIPELGEPYRVMDIGIKKYPCCYIEMHPIDAVLDLIQTHSISVDQVESIQVDVAPIFVNACRFHHPKDDDEARFSLPHSIACCFFDGKPWIESYSNERVNDPKVVAFRDKVDMVVHPEWDTPEQPLGGEIPIAIRLKDGSEYKKVCPKATDPIIISDEEIMNKYMRCALQVLSQSRAEQIAEIVLSLEKVHDISELTSSLSTPDR